MSSGSPRAGLERRKGGTSFSPMCMTHYRMVDMYEFSIGKRPQPNCISPAVLMLKTALRPSARDAGALGPVEYPRTIWDETDTALVIQWPRAGGAVTVAAYYPLKEEDFEEDIQTRTRNDRLNITVDNGMGAIGALHYLRSSFWLDPEEKGRVKELLPSLFLCLNRFADQLDLFPDHYMKTIL